MSQLDVMRFNFPTPIDFGVGARKKIIGELAERGLSKPLIVTDQGLAKLPLIHDYKVFLEGEGLNVGLYSGVVGNPVRSQVVAGVEAYRSHGADAVVAIGGGAAMDVAKVVALLINNPGDAFDYVDGDPNALPVDKEFPFLCALPTTAGTGSEVGRSSVVSDDDTHVKKIIFSPKMLPAHVFADPELTLELPASITAATGMDALSHCIEAYLAKGFHPMCDGIALEGIRLVAENLKACVDFATIGSDELDIDGEAGIMAHVQARSNMLLASLMGAVAFQKGLGVNHSMAHALSTVCDLHHGLANGVMLPFSMAFNEEGVPERFRRMEQAAGVGENHFNRWIEQLRAEIDIPADLSTLGVEEEHLEELVNVAVADPCHSLNPVEVTRLDFEGMFQAAIGC